MQRYKKSPKINSYGQSLLTGPVPHIPEKESFRAYASELEKTIHIVLQTIDFHGLNVGLAQLCNEYAKKNHNHSFHATYVIISRIDRQLQNKSTWCRSVHLKKLQHENAFTVHLHVIRVQSWATRAYQHQIALKVILLPIFICIRYFIAFISHSEPWLCLLYIVKCVLFTVGL